MSGIKRLHEVWDAYHRDSPDGKCLDELECVKFYNSNCLCSNSDCCKPIEYCYFENKNK